MPKCSIPSVGSTERGRADSQIRKIWLCILCLIFLTYVSRVPAASLARSFTVLELMLWLVAHASKNPPAIHTQFPAETSPISRLLRLPFPPPESWAARAQLSAGGTMSSIVSASGQEGACVRARVPCLLH